MEEMLESLKDTVEIPEDYRTLYDCMNREGAAGCFMQERTYPASAGAPARDDGQIHWMETPEHSDEMRPMISAVFP